MTLLKEGDVIKLEGGHRVYARLPKHCIYKNTVGVFDQIAGTEVTIGEPKNGLDTNFFAGRYVVTKTARDGGGGGGCGNFFPNGHHVFCRHVTLPIEVDFYQTGCFTAMNPDILPVGRATNTWTIDPDPA